MSAAWSARAYFIDWASGAGLYYSFDAGLLQVGRALAARPANEQLFLTPNYNDHYTVLWALNGRHISSFDGRQGLVLPDSSRAATYGIITYEDQTTSEALGRSFTHPEAQQHFLDAQGQDYAALVTFPIGASRVAPAPQFQPIRVADWAFLTGAQVSPPIPERDKTLRVFLEWRAVHAAERDYTVSVQLLGPLNPATQSPLWAQQDKQPIAGTYPTTRWQPGEMISESYTLRVPPDAPPGKYQIRVGLYDLPTGRRVPLIYSSSAPVADDAVPVLDFDLR